MNETMQTILTRRSIRAFKPDMLPHETIDAIIEAGLGDDDIAMRRQSIFHHRHSFCTSCY